LPDNQPCVAQVKESYAGRCCCREFHELAVDMTAPDTENGQFEEWMIDYEAKLREGVQKRFGLSHGTSNKNRPSDESTQEGTFQLNDEEGQ
jgi:hypothetical protein